MFRGRRRLFIAAAVAAILLLAGGGAAYWLTRSPGDVVNTDVPFVEPTPEPTPTPKPRAKRRDRRDRFTWPVYGFDLEHRRVFDPPRSLRGPWRRVWRRRAPALLEFPPVIARGTLFQLADNGQLKAMAKKGGRVRWKRRLGALAASTPVVDGRRLIVTLLEGRRGSRRGRVVCLRMRDGRIRWSRTLPSRSESSPVVQHGKVYFGSEDGTVYALRARTGREVWRYRASGAVKGSPTITGGVVYFGDYGGRVHAIRSVNGRRVWVRDVARRAFRTGTFYATAAAAFGRLYIGSTDGREYSLSLRDGALAWARQTGGYVYASAAVDDVPGLGPTVFVGSYDGVFYALNARTGRPRWKFRSGGKISGSATVVGDVVYFADLGRTRTFGLHTRTGKVLFRMQQGGYDPVISDGRRLYLTGWRTLTALEPRKRRRGGS